VLPPLSAHAEALDAAFARFLRLDVANGDAARETIRSYRGQVGAWVSWCRTATRRARSPTKLTVLRRFYQAAVSAGLRQDNPAAGIRPPREK
jgi:site-specific recombinase XerC